MDAEAVLAAARALAPAGEGLELHFVPDLKVYDGRFGANPWLQELPDPLTQLTWDNAALVSPATADAAGPEAAAAVPAGAAAAARWRCRCCHARAGR